MPSSRNPNAARAGAFVIVSIVLGVVAVVLLAGLKDKLQPTSRYAVRFSLADGAAGLEPDSEVRVGGRAVGRVLGVSFDTDTNGTVTGLLVRIAVRRDLVIHEGAVAFLERPLLGSGAVLNFMTLGDNATGPPLPEHGVITGKPQVPQFMAQAGYGDTQRQQLQDILGRADELTIKIDSAVDDIKAVVADARDRSGDWFDRTDAIFERVDNASTEIKEGTADARAFIASVQDAVDTNRPRVDEIVTNTRDASARFRDIGTHFNDVTLARIDELLDTGKAGADEARAAIERVDTLIADQSPNVRKALANARLASDQLRLASGEIRRTPWRLLYRPNEHELEFELLYDAARTYADAASDLRSAGESLDAVTNAGSATDEELVGYSDELTKAFETFHAAENRFLDLLIGNAP